MTDQEIAAKKARIFALAGVGIAAFVGSFMFGTEDVVSVVTSLVFVVAGLICFVIAGKIAKKLQKETAAK